MESEISSLIEISGEDDSLLQQSPANIDLDNFACSPLHLPSRSDTHTLPQISGTKTSADSRTLGSSSSYSNKENLGTSDNKSGLSNLSIEPQKMKRSRKGGYNLRKSLAWDRAFLTEEGVLNPLELSMITGTLSELDGDSLSVTDKDERDLTVDGSSNLKTLEENLFTELPSGKPNERNPARCSLQKRDSSVGGGLASASKSSQKIHPRHSVGSTVSRGKVTSSPVAPASQKRLLNMGTTKVMTRNSKIPKFPVSKQETCLPPTADSKIAKFPVSKRDSCLPPIADSKIAKFPVSKRDSCLPPIGDSKIAKLPVSRRDSCLPPVASGSGSKTTGVAQPAQKSVSSKVSSNIKSASSATRASLECTSKSSKSTAEDSRKDLTKPCMETKLLTNSQPQHTTELSRLPERASSDRLPTGGAVVIKSTDMISSTTVLSHHSSDSVDGNRKDIQTQRIKPSGLRMPSPSLRFFSEPKLPVSNAPSKGNIKPSNHLKPRISTSRNPGAVNDVHDFKQEQLLKKVINRNSIEKAAPSSPRIDKSLTSSFDPTEDSKVIQDACNLQEVTLEVPRGVETPHRNDNEQSRSQVHDDSGKECTDHVPIYLKDEERVRKDNKLVASFIESVEVDHKNSIVFQEDKIADENLLMNSFESCLQVQPIGTSTPSDASRKNREAQSHLVDEMALTSSVMNGKAMLGSETDCITQCNTLSLDANSGPSTSIFDNNKQLEEIDICSFSQTTSDGSMNMLIDGENLLPDGMSSLNSDECDYPVLVCEDKEVEKSEGEKSCNVMQTVGLDCYIANCNEGEHFQSVEVNKQHQHVDYEEGNAIVDYELLTMEASNCSEAQCDVSGKDDHLLTNGNLSSEEKEFSMKSKNDVYDNEDISSVGLENLAQLEHESEGRSSESHFSFLEASNEYAAQVHNSSVTFQDGVQVQCYRHEIVDYASDHCDSVADNQCNKVTADLNNQVNEEHIPHNDLLMSEPMIQGTELHLCCNIPSDHVSPERNKGEHDAQISSNMDKVYDISEKVEDQAKSLTILSNNGKDSTDQATDLELPSSATRSKDQVLISAANFNIEEPGSPHNKHDLQTRYAFKECIEYDKPESNASSREPEQHDGLTSENNCDKKGIDDLKEEEANARLKFPDDDKLKRPAPNAVPFTDEWLAAIEAAGEEILTLKTGAVEHSPPDKSIPEPGPWSPVKKKTTQEIGPFDCTKYTNAQPNNSD